MGLSVCQAIREMYFCFACMNMFVIHCFSVFANCDDATTAAAAAVVVSFCFTGLFFLNERKKSEELGELLGLEPVSLMIKKSRLRWFGHVERKDDNDWVKRCITWEVEGIGQREDARKRPGGIVLRMTWKV